MPLPSVGATVLCVLLFSSFAYSEFLVGPAEMGKSFSILCEGKGAAFVSEPDGVTVPLALDSSSQAEFTPQEAGPYTVQCGNDTKTVVVQQLQPAAITAQDGGIASALVLFSIMAFVALMAAASVYISKTLLGGMTRFSKTVSGNKARLLLRADRAMEKVEILDPVCFDHTGRTMSFSIPALRGGAEWSFEYSIASPERALPASLTATAGGKGMSMLSELYIEDGERKLQAEAGKRGPGGGEIGATGGIPATRSRDGSAHPRSGKRKLPKASR